MKHVDCLELYDKAEFYDLQNIDYVEDIPFYHRIASDLEGPILELASGTGRISLVLAKEGFDVTGIDVNSSMLRQAQKKSDRMNLDIRWIHADIRDYKLNQMFNLIMLPYNSISHIHDRESIEAMLHCVRQHLAEEGRFVVSMFVPNPKYLIRDPLERRPVSQFKHSLGLITITENNVYDSASQINRIKWYYQIPGKAEETVVELNMRMFYPQEFQSILYHNGFDLEIIYGDYQMSKFDRNSSMQIYVARKR
ncbi:class I SAM-dependent methyltransferase [bacterium]|nr:class I SAM-dependent methyltransferase [bacterium]